MCVGGVRTDGPQNGGQVACGEMKEAINSARGESRKLNREQGWDESGRINKCFQEFLAQAMVGCGE